MTPERRDRIAFTIAGLMAFAGLTLLMAAFLTS